MSEQVRSLFVNPATAGEIGESQRLSSLYFDKTSTFTSLGLDRRLAKAVAKMNYVYPSLVQAKTIPYILSGRDLLVRARTGTGKTAAYVLPILHKCLPSIDAQLTATGAAAFGQTGVFAIMLVPTRDLVDQVVASIKQFSFYISNFRVAGLNAEAKYPKQVDNEMQQLRLSPHIIVATPTRLLHHIQNGTPALQG
eukprot:UN00886